MKSGWTLSILAILLAACSVSPVTPTANPFPPPGPAAATPHVYTLQQGWFEGQAVKYFNFGTNTPLDPNDPSRVLVEGVWAFVTGQNADGSPIFLEGQQNLFEVKPGDKGYSDLWQPSFITPAEGYAPDSLKSVDEVLKSGMKIEKQPLLLNCPFVPPGSSLADNSLPLKKGWVNGEQATYFDFGPTSATPGKVYAFVTGFNADGSPLLVPGQHFVFDSARSAQGYSDFWVVQWVKVEAGYQADTIRSAADVDPASVTASTIVVNWPHAQL
jgi:hypothetical protein